MTGPAGYAQGFRANRRAEKNRFPLRKLRTWPADQPGSPDEGHGVVEIRCGVKWPCRRWGALYVRFGVLTWTVPVDVEPDRPVRVSVPAGTWCVDVPDGGRWGKNSGAVTVGEGQMVRLVINRRSVFTIELGGVLAWPPPE